jgi:hypothetical protein
MRRVVILGLGLLALGCSGDEPVRTVENPAGTCACRLDTQIDNLGVCVSPTTAFAPSHVFSSFLPDGATAPACDAWRDPQPLPSLAWSKVRVSAPCTGSGQLCITVRGGDSRTPLETDCTLATRCTNIDYAAAGAVLEQPALASWVAESSACAARYEQLGGYLEFRLTSDTLGCGDQTADVRRLPLCPARCQAEPSGDGCDVCGPAQIIASF